MNSRTRPANVYVSIAALLTLTFAALPQLVVHADEASNSIADDGEAQSSQPSETYLLRFRLEPGQKLRYQSSQTTNMQATWPAGTKTDVTKVEQRRRFSIGKIAEDGTADVAMQYEHLRMQLQSNDQEPIVFDSTMKPEEIPSTFKGAAAEFRKKSAATFELRPEGTPVSEDGVEQVAKGGQASFGLPLPVKPIAVGDSWKVQMPVQVRMAEKVMREITLLRSYRLKSVDDGIATIVFFTSVESPVKSPSIKGQLIQATPSGRFLFDIANGRVLRKEIKIDKSVLGAMGTSTILSVTSKTVERLLSDDELAADPKVTSR